MGVANPKKYRGPTDLVLGFQSEQSQRIVSEQEIESTIDANGRVDPTAGRQLLPGAIPAYLKSKRLDVHDLVSRKGPPTLFSTVTMNPWREEMNLLGLDTNPNSVDVFSPSKNKYSK